MAVVALIDRLQQADLILIEVWQFFQQEKETSNVSPVEWEAKR